jgi:hypothetical protein
MDKRHDSQRFSRLNVLVTAEAKRRIQHARSILQESTVNRVTDGQIVVDLAMEHLAEPPEGMNGGPKARRRRLKK